jgi:hypothetical protein
MQKKIAQRLKAARSPINHPSALIQELESRLLFTGSSLSVTFSGPVAPGTTFSCDISLANQGSTTANYVTADFYLSTTDDLSAAHTLLTPVTFTGAFEPGRTITKIERLTIPTTASGGNYFIVCQLNADGADPSDDFPTTPFSSGSFTITGGTATASTLAFAQQPTGTTTGSTITPAVTVDVTDTSGNIITTDDSNVTLTLSSDLGTLSGTTTEAAVDGVATFSNLSIATGGTYTLTATDGSLSSATSSSFTITVPGHTLTATSISLNASSPSITSGDSETLTAIVTPGTLTAALTGTVTFNLANGTTLGSEQISGETATLTTTALPVGDDQISASYSGDGTYAASSTTSPAVVDVTTAVPEGTLVPTILKSSLPASIVGGTKVHGSFSLSITNTGTTLSNGLDQIGIYASTTGSIDSSSTLIASLTNKKLKLKAGQTTKLSVPLKNLSLPAGSYTLLAQTTDYNKLVTPSTTGPSLVVAAPFVSVSAVVGPVKPVTVIAGKSVSVAVTLTNAGNINSTGKMNVAFGLSSDGATLAIPLTTVTKAVTVKSGGKATPLHLPFKIPVGTAAGTYFPYLTIVQGSVDLSVVGSVAFTIG